MDFNSLYHFVIVMEELSFTRAAKRLYLSQQAVSSQIKKLEDEVGAPLFTRKPTLLPTAAGTSLYHTATEIFRLHQEFQNELIKTSREESGEIRLGISYGRSRIFLPEIIEKMGERCPNVQLRVVEKMSSTVMERDVLNEETDFYIGLSPTHSPMVQSITLRQDSLVLVIPKPMVDDFRKTHNLAPDEKFDTKFSINALTKYPFILPSAENNLRFMFNRYVSSLNFLPKILMESEQSDTLFSLSLDGIGISIYPEVTFSYWKRRLSPETLDRVEVVPLNNMTEAKLVLGYKKQRRLSALDHLFVDLVRNISYFNLT